MKTRMVACLLFWLLWLVGLSFLVWSLLTGPNTWEGSGIWIASLFGSEAAWIIRYFLAGFWAGSGTIFLWMGLRRKKADLPLSLVVHILLTVYLCQTVGYIWLRHFHWALLLPLIILLGFVLFVRMLAGRNAVDVDEACDMCRRRAGFTLTENVDTQEDSVPYCRTHFLEALGEWLDTYDGFFVFHSPQISRDTDMAQYIFYKPDDLARDNYPTSDVRAIEDLIDISLERVAGDSEEYICVKIPADAVKDIVTFDDGSLLARDITSDEMIPMTRLELIAYLRSELRRIDTGEITLSMNLPYAERGIYLYHNHI